MMRRSREEKAKSRERIVEVAAARIREAGTEAPGVAEIMRDAGMTHGGFYKHFESRDELVAAALEQATAEGDAYVNELTAGAEDPLTAFVEWYVSAEHVADPAAGCAVAALGADVGRGGERLQALYRAQVERYLERLERLLGSRQRATVALATLVGAITVARAVGEPVLAGEILGDVRAALKSGA
jgi:TetR/AcrR family transcriptional regulator, transcriptional repressor for nem operon